jgi:hypothetical protein
VTSDCYVLSCTGLAQNLARFDNSSGYTKYYRTMTCIINIKQASLVLSLFVSMLLKVL